jgi:hypothetical protein
MQVINPHNTQTFHDIALQYYGSVIYATDIAHENGMCVTDDITGIPITLPVIEITADELKIVREINKLNSQIASKYPL